MKKMCGIFKTVTIMKKIMKPFVLVAAAAMALASCQKNEMPAPEKQDVHFTINAGIETKTSIVETLEDGKTIYKAQWDGNEELGLLFAAPNKDTEAKDVVKLTNAETGNIASFQGKVTVEGTAGTFYAFYPAFAFNRGYEEGDARLDLKNVQKPTATSFDPTCDILVAKPYDYVVEDGAVVADGLEFARIMSVLRIDLKSDFEDVQNEFVESVSFTAGDVDITGYARIFLDNPKFDKWASSGDQWCTVTANYDSELVSINGESKSVYLVIAPVTIPADEDLTFEIKTKNYNISKTVKSPEMKFTAGKVSKLNLTIKEENCEKVDVTVDYSGEYLIAGKEGEKWYAAKKYTSGNYLTVSEIEFAGENIIETETISDHYMTIEKVVGGDYDGMYTIVDAGGKYLSTSSSSSNDMKAVASVSKDTYWTIVKDEAKGTYSIVASKSQNSRNDMRFNYNGGTNSRVSCYDGSKTSQPYLTLFSTSLVKPDTTPKIFVENTSYSASATDTSVEIPYTVKNITGAITAALANGATLKNVKATVADDKVTVTFDANTESTQKTATIVLLYEGAESVNVTVIQAAKAAEGGEDTPVFVKVTSAPSDWSGTYLIVFEEASKCWDGSLNGGTSSGQFGHTAGLKAITIKSNTIENNDSYFIISKAATNYTITSASGSCIGNSGTSAGLKIGTYTCSITLNSDNTVNILASDGNTQVLHNKSAGYVRFYKTSNVGSTSYGMPCLYKLTSGSEGGNTPEQPTLSPRNLAFSASTATATMGQAFTAPTLSGVTTDVTYSSSNESVATVDASTGEVTLVGAGETTITASAPETAEYEAESASYSLTVAAAPAAKFVKVTTAPDDWSGTYLLVCEANSMAFSGLTDNIGVGSPVTITDGKIEATEANSAWRLVVDNETLGHYNIKLANKYLNFVMSFALSNNADSGSFWKLTVSDGNVTVANYIDKNYVIGWDSSNHQFACSSKSMTAIQLYRLEGTIEDEIPNMANLASRDLAFSDVEATATMGQTFTAPTLRGETTGVTYSSSNTSVARVNATTGTVTLVGAGTATIRATAPITNQYQAGTASYRLEVSEASATQEYTYTWTSSSGALGTTANGTVTKTLNSVNWTIQRSGSSGYTGWTSNVIQIGKSGAPESLTLKTSGIEGTIKSVSVECASYQAKHNVSISVGGVSYVSSKATPSWTTVGTISGEGTSSGDVEIKFSAGTSARALYIKSIKIVYEN